MDFKEAYRSELGNSQFRGNSIYPIIQNNKIGIYT